MLQVREDFAEVRKQIALLARRKEARIVPRSAQMPCRWEPTSVINLNSELPFTDVGVWHYIADLAESGHPIEEITLNQPKGEKAYVMIVDLGETAARLYIKVQLKRGRIFGRSFHYSTK